MLLSVCCVIVQLINYQSFNHQSSHKRYIGDKDNNGNKDNNARHVLPAYILKLLMDSLVMSHMQYALSVWGPSLTQNQLLRLQRLQNRAVRLVFSLNKSDHISEYYQELRWLRVSQLIQFCIACVMYHQYNAVR